MKITFFENQYGTSFELTPETPEEVATLLRITNNTLAEKPEIALHFSKEPTLNIWMRKVKPVAQRNSLSNKK